jgi:hypothetical protein
LLHGLGDLRPVAERLLTIEKSDVPPSGTRETAGLTVSQSAPTNEDGLGGNDITGRERNHPLEYGSG